MSQIAILIRLARGIFYYPIIDKKNGITLLPSIEEIAEAFAKRDKARIIPTGVYAMNKLGLSTQVPINVVFLTDTTPRKVKIGRRWITFKQSPAKNFAYKSKITMLVSLALSEIGKDWKKSGNKPVLHKIRALCDEESNITYVITDNWKVIPIILTLKIILQERENLKLMLIIVHKSTLLKWRCLTCI